MIIHHIAPKNKSDWHPLWIKCYESWKKVFGNNYEFKLWNDKEDIDRLVKNKYNKFYDIYRSFPAHIMKIDFARLCILHSYGGIYSDMDVFCYKDFTDYFNGESENYLLEAPYGDIPIENALMVSLNSNSKFFEFCIEESINSYLILSKNLKITYPWDNKTNKELILNTAGPALIYNSAVKYGIKNIGILEGKLFNNHGMSYDSSFYTKHILTGVWGKEAINHLKKQFKLNNENCKTFNDFIKHIYIKDVKKYANMNNVTVETFDFYTDYTNGNYLK